MKPLGTLLEWYEDAVGISLVVRTPSGAVEEVQCGLPVAQRRDLAISTSRGDVLCGEDRIAHLLAVARVVPELLEPREQDEADNRRERNAELRASGKLNAQGRFVVESREGHHVVRDTLTGTVLGRDEELQRLSDADHARQFAALLEGRALQVK